MNELIGAISRVRQAWETIATARAGEDAQLNQMLGIKGGYPEILLRISHWDTKARSWSTLSKRKKAIVQQEQKLAEVALAQLVHCLNQHSNGVSWLISNTAFAALLGHIDLTITTMDRILTKESIIAANVIGEQFSSQINRVEAASEVAANLIDAEVKLRATATSAENLLREITSHKSSSADLITQFQQETKAASEQIASQVTELKSDFERKSSSVEEAANSSQETLDELASTLEKQITDVKKQAEEAATFRAKAEKASADTNADRDSAKQSFAASMQHLSDANEKLEQSKSALTGALRNVRRQGLSGAFFEKAEEVRLQRAQEQKVFQQALLFLVTVGVLGLTIESLHGFPADLTQWVLRSFRTLVIAAPGIWIAWMSARRLSALNRMVSDYEYKSAAALAFESYRQEVEVSGNKALMEELLATAILTFGQNPTRYYEEVKDEAVMPSESLLEKFRWKTKTRGADIPSLPSPSV